MHAYCRRDRETLTDVARSRRLDASKWSMIVSTQHLELIVRVTVVPFRAISVQS